MKDAGPNLRARRRTSFHEAGHAIVALALGAEVMRAWLEDDFSGRVETGPVDHLRIVDQIAIAMGGRAGAALSGVEVLHDSELQGDNANSIRITSRAFPDDPDFSEILHSAGCDRAEALVSEHKDLVALVASELERRGELCAFDLDQLLGAKLDRGGK